jgi:hypothetical protein
MYGVLVFRLHAMSRNVFQSYLCILCDGWVYLFLIKERSELNFIIKRNIVLGTKAVLTRKTAQKQWLIRFFY